MEEPLEIRLNGESYLVTMRTPGNDIDLVHGLLYSERIITDRSDIVLALLRRIWPGWGQQLQRVGRDPGATQISVPSSGPPQRHDDQRVRYLRHHQHRPGTARVAVPGRPRGTQVAAELVLSAPIRLRRASASIRPYGWAACGRAAWADSEMVCVREDVGRTTPSTRSSAGPSSSSCSRCAR